MENNWIYKADGTIQCEKEPTAISLEEMAEQLISVIGEDAIVQQIKLHRPTIKMCGVATGAINVYELTPKGFLLWETGVVGKMGFEQLDPDLIPKNSDTQYMATAIDGLDGPSPTQISELPGHSLRTYRTGDLITMDLRPSRFNVELSATEGNKIVSVWFG